MWHMLTHTHTYWRDIIYLKYFKKNEPPGLPWTHLVTSQRRSARTRRSWPIAASWCPAPPATCTSGHLAPCTSASPSWWPRTVAGSRARCGIQVQRPPSTRAAWWGWEWLSPLGARGQARRRRSPGGGRRATDGQCRPLAAAPSPRPPPGGCWTPSRSGRCPGLSLHTWPHGLRWSCPPQLLCERPGVPDTTSHKYVAILSL